MQAAPHLERKAEMIAIMIADGFEEIEALTPVDVLRRAGFDARTVAVGSKVAVGSHGIAVVCDMTADEVKLDELTMVVFPGGMPGALNLDASPYTDKFIEAVKKNGGRIAAICAAPLVLGRRGLLNGKRAICYPGFENELTGAIITNAPVVTDGNIRTAYGMEAALPFAKELVRVILEKKEEKVEKTEFDFPSIDLLHKPDKDENDGTDEITETADKLISLMEQFDISICIKGIERGPRITRYEIVPAAGVRVQKILNLVDDIAINLGIAGIRIVAPIPGKSALGIEIPNKSPKVVFLRELLDTKEFKENKSPTFVGIGKDISGSAVFADIAKMPHMLIAGAAGMGKSVCINSIITSILYKARPDEVKLIMIDPKAVEFSAYNGIPHLLVPVITDTKQTIGALKWVIDEMYRRYELMEKCEVRSLNAYNDLVRERTGLGETLPRIVIFIDELADLMLVARKPIEELIMTIAQKARAAGIHLIIGTQRPSVDVITGVIKANIPSRISCKVSTLTDSRTIIDRLGAEKLLNNGDMLFYPVGAAAPSRVQCAFVSYGETEDITNYLKTFSDENTYDQNVIGEMKRAADKYTSSVRCEIEDEDDEPISSFFGDEKFLDAVELAIKNGKISTSLLQRKLYIGYGKAAKYIDVMEELGVISEHCGQKPRDVLISLDEWHDILSRNGNDD